MTLSNYRDAYYEHSGKASDVARTLALSGIALIWVFAVEGADGYKVPKELIRPGLLIVVCLMLDFAQYVAATIIWGTFSRYHEKQGKRPDDELEAPSWLNWPALIFFYSKLVAVALAYVLLGCFLWGELVA